MAPRGVLVAAGAVAIAGVASIAGVLSPGADNADGSGLLAAAAGLLAASAAFASLRGRVAAVGAPVALGGALVAFRIAAGLFVATPESPATLPTSSGEWTARVEAAKQSRGAQSVVLDVTEPPVRCAASLAGTERLIPGDFVRWRGRFRAPPDGGYGDYLRATGIVAICRVDGLDVLASDASPAAMLERLRQASGDALASVLPEPAAGLEAGILIGLRDRVDAGLAADFTTAGVSHIVAISGWNIAVVGGAIAAVLRRTSRRRRTFATLLAIALYTLFAGASPSVVRAAVMAGVVLLAAETGRGARALPALGWAVTLMLVAEPRAVGDVGLQLSAAATAGLIAWGTPLAAWLESRAPRVPAAVRESLAVSLAAQAATLPIILLAFGRLSLVAPFVNLVAVPLVPPVMAAGAIAFLAGWLVTLGAPGWLGTTVALPAWASLEALIEVVRAAARVPLASASIPAPANVVAAIAAAVGAVALHRVLGARRASPRHAIPVAVRRKRRRWDAASLRLALVVVLVSSMAGCVLVSRLRTSAEIVVLDVGQGDAILVESPEGGRLLVDGGPDPALLVTALDAVVPAWDRRLDAVVLTHPHDDHAAGLAGLVGRYRFEAAFESGGGTGGNGYRAWSEALRRAGVSPRTLAAGDELSLGSIRLDVVWPDRGAVSSEGATDGRLDPADSANRRTNDASLVLLGTLDGTTFLLTGDAEDDVDPLLLERRLPRVDVLKVAHHGSGTSSSADLLAAIRPSVAVISVGRDNSYGHPSPGTLGRLAAAGARVLRSDEAGTIRLGIGGGVSIRTDGPRPVAGSEPWHPPRASASTMPIAPGDAASAGDPRIDGRRGVRRSGLLYDSRDVCAEPASGGVLARLPRSTTLAPAALAGGRRSGGLARDARRGRRRRGRSPPRGNRGSPA